ncbi:hypothetical protein [Nonomuraea sp. NPDC049784]|uniref:hypothetical protein n=1 Tax=Nonomuraea sp. NPDC049784 TaxID=3154361 RepID=UPI0033F546F1
MSRSPFPRPASAALLAFLLHAMMGAPAATDAERGRTRPTDEGAISIRVLEIPANRVDDPRSHVFIVDHVNPGTTFTRRLEVRSTSAKPQHVELYAAAASINRGRFTFAPDRGSNELTSWIRLDRSAADLPPRGSARVKATVAVPQWAGKGERYAVIWAQVSSEPADGIHGNVTLVNRVGVRAYLDVGPGGEPPSDFQIGTIIPQRAEDGRPKIVAAVSNTGERAVDLNGQLTLTDGPSSLSAGPYLIDRGTTLAPGERGNVTAQLGKELPDGPWTFHLTLNSGRVSHTLTGTLTFPAKPGTWGLAASVDSPWTLALALAALVILIAASVILLLRFRRFRARAFASGPANEESTGSTG